MAAALFHESIMAQVILAPNPVPTDGFKVFLAGTIELGKSEDWQAAIATKLDDLNVTLLNPRRIAFNEADIEEQIIWELDAMEKANLIVMHFEADTKSPITLLELGLWARSGKLVVHCPEGFWRRQNVLLTASRYSTPIVDSLDDLVVRIEAAYWPWHHHQKFLNEPIETKRLRMPAGWDEDGDNQ